VKKHYISCIRVKKYFIAAFKNKWFLDSSASAYFTLFESNFVDITSDNYSQVKTANSKALLFILKL